MTARGYSRAFAERVLEPFAAAIWSTPAVRVLDYPVASFLRFFANHGLLQVLDMPLWSTVSGGARSYVEKAQQRFSEIRLGAPVESEERAADGVRVRDAAGAEDRFDAVVIATHADAALGMLARPSEDERRILGAFRYQPNQCYLHTDAALMPKRRKVWSSWNYMGGEDGVAVTYWMNRLQNLPTREAVFVTLNPHRPVDPARIVAQCAYTHPMYDVATASAQKAIWRLQGAPGGEGYGGVFYCGAHFGQGFHEDAVQAGFAAAEAVLPVRRPWTVPNESGRIHLAAAGARPPESVTSESVTPDPAISG